MAGCSAVGDKNVTAGATFKNIMKRQPPVNAMLFNDPTQGNRNVFVVQLHLLDDFVDPCCWGVVDCVVQMKS